MHFLRFLADNPQPLNPNTTPTASPTFDASSMAGLFMNVFQWLVILSSVLAAVFLVMAGFQYITTDAFGKKSEAKKRVQEIILGLVIALTSVTLLTFINPAILDIDLGAIGANSQKIGAADKTSTYILTDQADTIISGQPAPAGTTQPTQGTSGQLSTEQVNTMWGGRNITVNNSDRTSLEGLRQVTVLGVVHMVDATGIDGLVITGGTEAGHATGDYSHANGYKVDIGENSNKGNWAQITNYFENAVGGPIQRGTTYTAETSSYTMKILLHGEANHFDVAFIPK